MPTVELLEYCRFKFRDVDVKYFGSIIWLAPLLYKIVGNKELTKKLYDLNLRAKTIRHLKDELSGIYRKND